MLYENSHNKMAPTTARPISSPRQPARERPLQNILPKTGAAIPKPVGKPNPTITGWPTATKLTPGQTVGTAVKTMPVKNRVSVSGGATKFTVPVTGWPSASKQLPGQIARRSVQNAGKSLQNTGSVQGRSMANKKPLSSVTNSVSFKRPLQRSVAGTQIKPVVSRQASNLNKITGVYQTKPVTNWQVKNWGNNRLAGVPLQKTIYYKNGLPYKYNAANGSSVQPPFINRGNYVGRGVVNGSTYYRNNNRLPANTQIAVPTQAGMTAGATQYQRNRRSGAYQQAPCSCKSCNGHAQASIPSINEPSNFPGNTGHYGGNVTEQLPPLPSKPIGICHTCGKTGNGCTTIARFTFNSFQLKNRHKAQLKELAKNILNKKINVIIATGHTDSSGTEDYNQDLGAKRAATVISELRKQLSLLKPNAQRALLWRTDSKGETKPVATNNAANNRRVEVCLRRTKL